jgi:hypothetical protein
MVLIIIYNFYVYSFYLELSYNYKNLQFIFPKLALGLCRLFLDAPWKYRDIEVWRIPPFWRQHHTSLGLYFYEL